MGDRLEYLKRFAAIAVPFVGERIAVDKYYVALGDYPGRARSGLETFARNTFIFAWGVVRVSELIKGNYMDFLAYTASMELLGFVPEIKYTSFVSGIRRRFHSALRLLDERLHKE